MPTSAHFRQVASTVLKVVSLLLGTAAVLSYFFGGRALHDFASIGRLFGEAIGLAFALVIGMIALFLKTFAEQIEEHDDGAPVSLSIGATEKNDEPQ